MIIYINHKKLGKVPFVIDDRDYPLVKQFTWHLLRNHAKGSVRLYARSNFIIYNIKTRQRSSYPVLLHRLVLGLNFDRSVVADHIDRDTQNNCRSNLRAVDPRGNRQNQCNNSSSGYHGVEKMPNGKFRARVRLPNNINVHLGYYSSAEEAAIISNLARDEIGHLGPRNIITKKESA